MAVYTSGVAVSGFYYAFTNPLDIVRENYIVITSLTNIVAG